MISKSHIGKGLEVIWILAFISLLVFAYVQQDIHDMPVAFTWLAILFTFPIGLFIAPLVGMTTSSFMGYFGIEYQAFYNLIPMWTALAIAGYLQWFVIVPRAFKKIWNK